MKATVNGRMYSGTRDITIAEIQLEGNQEEYIRSFIGKHIDVSVKQFRRKRSLDANAYYWSLIGKLRFETGQRVTDIYRDHIKEVGNNSITLCLMNNVVDEFRAFWEAKGMGWVTQILPSKIERCTNVICYYGSSEYNVQQMSKLIDLRIQDCQAVGVETMTPSQIREMLAFMEGDGK